jgi:chromosome partitioning protein
LTKCIAFHSYKGGTGKTTLAANFAALLAKRGYCVFLLDIDVYAPSLQSYFETVPKKWINDFLYGSAELEEVIQDFTPLIESHGSASNNSDKTKRGHLWIGFSNANKEDIYKLEGGAGTASTKRLFRKFILLMQLLRSEHHADYIIIDTSPGIRYWSINALVVADALLLTLKMGDIDIAGTRKLVQEIYGSLTKFGTKSFLLWNRVTGYCFPHGFRDDTTASAHTGMIGTLNQPAKPSSLLMDKQQTMLASETGMEVISAIPCYCDIQFSRKEFLTVLNQPRHPFTKQFEQLVQAVETIYRIT